MTDNGEFQIGTSNFDGRGGMFTRKKWFYLEDNKDNVYRVLPPVLSLAATGNYYKYHAVHRNLRGADGKQRAFVCCEDVDFKTKIIKVHCPLCDKVRELEAQLDTAKNSGATPDQLKAFRIQNIMPLQVERRFFLNVVNQAGEIGILPIPSKLKNDMEATLKKLKASGIDATAGRGLFLNFTKTSRFKGDKDVIYKCDPFMTQTLVNGAPQFTYMTHDITPDFIDKMKRDCADLSFIHKTLDIESMAMLAALDVKGRSELLTKLFSNLEGEEEPRTLSGTVGLPGGATGAVRVDMTPTAVHVSAPSVLPAAAQAPLPSAVQTQAPQPAPVQQAPAKAATKAMSDEDFIKTFGLK